jgi:hypothetical protein
MANNVTALSYCPFSKVYVIVRNEYQKSQKTALLSHFPVLKMQKMEQKMGIGPKRKAFCT